MTRRLVRVYESTREFDNLGCNKQTGFIPTLTSIGNPFVFVTILLMVGLDKWNVRIDCSVFYFMFDWAWMDWISEMEELIVLLD